MGNMVEEAPSRILGEEEVGSFRCTVLGGRGCQLWSGRGLATIFGTHRPSPPSQAFRCAAGPPALPEAGGNVSLLELSNPGGEATQGRARDCNPRLRWKRSSGPRSDAPYPVSVSTRPAFP